MNLTRLIAACVAVLFCVNAFAADDADNDNANDDGNWDFQLTPLYYWSLNIGGSAQIDDPSAPPVVPVDLDVFGLQFKGAFSLNFDARYRDRWGLIFDTVGVRLSGEQSDDDELFLDFRYKQAELSGYYRLTSGGHSWDLLAGARYYRADMSLEGTSRASDASWVDPLVGARWIWPFAEKWKLNLRGDIGGFGVGSDFVWQLWGSVEWFPWKNVGFVGGLRAMDLDYSEDDVALNIQIWGPVLGATFRW
jgi:hypothetical protein